MQRGLRQKFPPSFQSTVHSLIIQLCVCVCLCACIVCVLCHCLEIASNVEYAEVTVPLQISQHHFRLIPNTLYSTTSGAEHGRYAYVHYSVCRTYLLCAAWEGLWLSAIMRKTYRTGVNSIPSHTDDLHNKKKILMCNKMYVGVHTLCIYIYVQIYIHTYIHTYIHYDAVEAVACDVWC